jgi:L-alanine-DL-glutamate epimerase-like enolase superfamily enzyme
MAIVKAELKPCVQRQADTEWSFTRGRVSELRGWIVLLTDDAGTTGLGYGHALPTVSTNSEAARAGLEFLLPRLIGRDPRAIAAIMPDLDRALAGLHNVKAAIDMALHDLLARQLNVPLDVLLGGRRRTAIPQARIVSLKSPDEMATNARQLVDEGYRALKLKFNGDADTDVARVEAVRKAVGVGVMLMIDTNQSYAAKTFIRTFSRIERYNIALVEQPVPTADIAGLKLVTTTLPVPIEADESAGSLADVHRLVGERAVDAINLKITKLGGLRNAMAAINICEAGGVACRLGAAFGPALLQAFSSHVASVFAELPFPCELTEHLHLHDDPFTEFPCTNGSVMVATSVGCGASLDLAKAAESVAVFT